MYIVRIPRDIVVIGLCGHSVYYQLWFLPLLPFFPFPSAKYLWSMLGFTPETNFTAKYLINILFLLNFKRIFHYYLIFPLSPMIQKYIQNAPCLNFQMSHKLTDWRCLWTLEIMTTVKNEGPVSGAVLRNLSGKEGEWELTQECHECKWRDHKTAIQHGPRAEGDDIFALSRGRTLIRTLSQLKSLSNHIRKCSV